MYTPLEQIDDQRVTDQYLRAFSKSIPRILAYTRFSIHWNHRAFLQDDTLLTRVEGFHIRGHHDYRGFDMRPWMFPSHMLFSYELHRGDTIFVLGDSLSPEQTTTGRIPLPGTLSACTAMPKSFSYTLIYTPEQQNTFSNITDAVDQYYMDYPLIQDNLKAIESLKPDNLNMLPIYNARLREVEATLTELHQRIYLTVPELEDQDPLNFFPLYEDLNSRASSLRKEIDHRMQNLDRLYYEQGLSLQGQDTALSRSYFQRSVRVNPYFAPAWLALARLDIQAKKPAQAAGKVEEILTQLKPDTLTYRKTLELADTLSEAFVEKANAYMDKSDYNRAVSIMERAEQYCLNTPGYQCPEAVNKHLTLARYGIYNAYVSVAQKAIARNRPDLALEYINMADAFQQNHASSIISNKEVRDLYDQVTVLFTRQAQALIREGEYHKALAHLKDARKLCHSDPCREKTGRQLATARQGIYMDNLLRSREMLLNDHLTGAELFLTQAKDYLREHSTMVDKYPLQDSLEQAVCIIQYTTLLKGSGEHLRQGKKGKALAALVKADSLLSIHSFETNDTLVPLIRQLARPKVIHLANQIQRDLHKGDYREAPQQLQQLRNYISGYYLKTDRELISKADSLDHYFTQIICYPVKEQFKQLHQKASVRFIQARYGHAQQLYLQALDTARANPHCHMDTTALKQTLRQKQAVFHYASLEEKLDKAFEKKDFSRMVQLIEQMEHYYHDNDLQAEAVSLIRPVAFAREKNHIGLSLFMTRHYMEAGRELEALHIFKGLEQKNIPPDVSREVQKKLAAVLAARDAKTGLEGHYREQAEAYSGNAYWLRHLERYYKSHYRREQRIFPWIF